MLGILMALLLVDWGFRKTGNKVSESALPAVEVGPGGSVPRGVANQEAIRAEWHEAAFQ